MRPIDADALLEKMQRTSRYFSVVYDVDAMPTLDVAPVVHGRWKLLVSGNGVCSVCHFTTVHVWDFDSSLSYCPHCGATMDGGDSDAESV